MSFSQAEVNGLFDAIVSDLLALGVFDSVNQHEPKSTPQNGVTASVWIDRFTPVGRASGLSAVSGVVVFNMRIYTSMVSMPFDYIDPNVATAAMTVMDTFSNDYTLGGMVRNVDLLGMYGVPLAWQAGYIEIDRKMFRQVTLSVPLVINDLFTMEP